ncbi:MAG TPA: sigma-70 factor domain-containing protein, partial [Anaeromyxobacteraceae bacterium]
MSRRRKPAETRRVPAAESQPAPAEERPAAPPEEAEVVPADEAETAPAEEAAATPGVEAEVVLDEDDEPGPGLAAGPGRRALPAPRSDREPGGGLVRYDPLRAYMAEVARHPVLSREEEHELAVRFYRNRDVQAAYALVAANLRLVVKIAHQYRRAAFQLLDLVQEGNIGLMQAVQKF